jgi:hypothetical protein
MRTVSSMEALHAREDTRSTHGSPQFASASVRVAVSGRFR